MQTKLIRISLIAICSFILLMSSGCSINNNKQIKEEIFNLIESNVEMLEKYIKNEEYNKISTEFNLIELSNEIEDDNIQLINFEHSKDGTFTAMSIFGVYYKSDNNPSTVPYGNELELVEYEDGWIARTDGDWYYTERIVENWFYYRIST